MLLLKQRGSAALVVAYAVGAILFTITLLFDDLSIVYISTVITGATDFILPLLFLYAKKYIHAIGATALFFQSIVPPGP